MPLPFDPSPITNPFYDLRAWVAPKNPTLFVDEPACRRAMDLWWASSSHEVDALDKHGCTALLHACVNHQVSAVTWLLDHGANPMFCTNQGLTPMFATLEEPAQNGVLFSVHEQDEAPERVERVLRLLLAAGARPDAVQWTGWAALNRHHQMDENINNGYELWLERLANGQSVEDLPLPAEPSDVNDPALEQTLKNMMARMLKTGLNDGRLRRDSLYSWTNRTHPHLMEVLHKVGIPVHQPVGLGPTANALHVWVFKDASSVEGLRRMLEWGADPTALDSKGRLPHEAQTLQAGNARRYLAPVLHAAYEEQRLRAVANLAPSTQALVAPRSRL